jgi:asparagine synthase (glutamine-hydrolysing)
MSGIAAIVYWDESVIDETAVGRMLASIPHRSPDGSTVASGSNCSMGFARMATTLRERTAVQPLHDEQDGIWLVGDVRLDNREDLNETLQGRGYPVPSDPELLVLGYRRWGNDLARHLVGDFAFVLWDERDRALYAARDPFGFGPLYYHSNADRLVFATEVTQILALRDFECKIEERLVVDYLADTYRHERETFFQDVFRVLPGHYMVWKDRAWREARYWFPPTQELRLGRPEDYHAEFRRLFEQSVADRLESDGRPIIANLSGGLDSSSVVCMADAIYDQGPPARPPLYTASALFPGLACDEMPFIDAVTRKVRFTSERWDGTVPDWEDLQRPHVADPSRDEQSGFFSGLYRLAARVGARVVLNGEGGDQVLTEYGVFRDLAANHRWLRLFQEALSIHRNTKRGWKHWVKDGVFYTSPQVLQRAYNSFLKKRNVPPAWVAGGLRDRWSSVPWVPGVLAGDSWLSHTQQCTWDILTGSIYGMWVVEWQELWMARRGLSRRSPFFDLRLVDFVLAVPFEQRLPGGKWKRLLRKAMAGLLPDQLAHREGVTVFTSNVKLQFRRHLPFLQDIISDGAEWLSGPYVNQDEAKKLLQDLASEEASKIDWRETLALWNIATLELWLRDLRRAFGS